MSDKTTQTLEVNSRQDSGKGVARKLRANDLVPAVCYGQDSEPRKLSVAPDDIIGLFEGPQRQNVVFSLKVDGEQTIENVMVKTYQLSPVRRDLLHVDFQIVDLDQPIRTKVPLESVGRPKGVRLGGILNVIRPDIDIRARPLDIPPTIKVEVGDLEPGNTILASDVVLPEGVEPGFKSNYGLFRVVMPRKRAALNAEGEEETAAAPV